MSSILQPADVEAKNDPLPGWEKFIFTAPVTMFQSLTKYDPVACVTRRQTTESPMTIHPNM